MRLWCQEMNRVYWGSSSELHQRIGRRFIDTPTGAGCYLNSVRCSQELGILSG